MPAPLALAALVLPLGLDTFALSAAIGLAGVSPRERCRLTLLFAAFEGLMPLAGLLGGGLLSRGQTRAAGLAAIVLLAGLGGWMLAKGRSGPEAAEQARLGRLAAARGLAAAGLGITVSLDELAIGFSFGLLRLPATAAVVLIALQAVLVTQLGLRLGARVGDRVLENAERLAGLVLVALAAYLLVGRLTGRVS